LSIVTCHLLFSLPKTIEFQNTYWKLELPGNTFPIWSRRRRDWERDGTYFFNNRVSNNRVPNYEFYNPDGKMNETKIEAKFFVFLRHSSFLDRYSITITQAT